MGPPTNTEAIRRLEQSVAAMDVRLGNLERTIDRYDDHISVLRGDLREISVLLARLDERVKTLEQHSTGRSARTWAVWTLLASALLSLGGGLLGAWLKGRLGIP